ncbi:hypothetical protein OROGR_009304 [Orobanche gracilis]
MIEKTIKPPKDITLIIQQCKTLNHIKQIHASLVKHPSFRKPAAVNSFLLFTATSINSAFFSYGCALFQSLLQRTTFQYNTMIRGYLQSNQPREAILCYKDMLKDGLIRNNYTFTPLVKACSKVLPELWYVGLLIHAHVFKLGFCVDPFIVSALIELCASNHDMGTAEELFEGIPVRDVVLWTAMIDGYGIAGDVGRAREWFDKMPQRNVISWSAIMAAYSRASDFKEVLCLYRRMEDLGFKPNESVLVSALTACANVGALAQGLWLHSYAMKCRFETNSILATSLVDMYSKCGCVKLALNVFEDIHNKDSAAWSAIISGLASNGEGVKSLELFDVMISSGTRPTEVTFVAVLTACTHAKLLEKGLYLFASMSKIYKIEPKMEHYACVVDLLARSGKLVEAEKFIEEKMDGIFDGDKNVWGALLGACRVYGNVDIGNKLWSKLVKKGVVDYGIHVLAYNMYREAGWDAEAKCVRRLIEKEEMKKIPGCSAVEVNGIVEEFFAGDILHPRADEMCRILDCLLYNMACSATVYVCDNGTCNL